MKQKLKHILIAGSHNSHRPQLLTGVGALWLVSFIFLLAFFSDYAGRKITTSEFGAAVYPSVLVKLANDDRADLKLRPLAVNPLLEKAARMKAEDMARKGYFAHVSPEGISPWYWMREAGYAYIYAGENLAIDFSQSDDIQKAWMNSQSHRANLLNPHFTEVGIAIERGEFEGKETVFVVEMFGTPRYPAVLEKQPAAVWHEAIAVEPRKIAAFLNVGLSVVVLLSVLSLAYVEVRHKDKRHMLIAVALIVLALVIALLEWYGMSHVRIV